MKDGWLPDILARLQIRYREIPIVFADSRKFAEEWTYRFLATALADLDQSADAGEVNQNGMSSPYPSQSDPSAEAAVSDSSVAATSRTRSSSR